MKVYLTRTTTLEDINRYEHTTKTFLCNIRIPLEALLCTDNGHRQYVC